MATIAQVVGPEVTSFTRDVLGRYVCNTLGEAKDAQNPAINADARPFDVIVVGGGSFAGVFAQHLLTVDAGRRHRILVLEAGPMLVSEHVQNLPMIGLDVPGATSIADLRAAGQATTPRNEVWGLAWHSDIPFTGLAYCVGGRSLYWGGWSPQPLPDELADWPAAVVADLTDPKGYTEAAQQLGSDTTNDFIYGPLQNALRRVVADGTFTHALPLSTLPDLPAVAALGAAATPATVAGVLGLSGTDGRTLAKLKDEAKLEAPLAVQAVTRPGFFPGNKFSAAPLAVEAARTAWGEWPRLDNLRRRLMVVPNCHVEKLVADGGRVNKVQTNQGDIDVPQGALVVIAAGTIESTRLAQVSFDGLPDTSAIGQHLAAHLRSNLTIRVPRTSLPVDPAISELSEAALFLKGRATVQGQERFFHLQITAAGLGQQGNNSEAELWKKIPDIDTLGRFQTASDSHVVITLRGLGEMDTDNPNSFVRKDPELDYGTNRAFVGLEPSPRDADLWNAMDVCSDEVALAFAGGEDYEVLLDQGSNQWRTVTGGTPAKTVLGFSRPRRDQLGTTHHEACSLRMGTDPATSATDSDGRLHGVSNAYALGPATFPRLGSPNPMLTGVALARRLAEHLAPSPGPQQDGTAGEVLPFAAADGYQVLFDGMDASRWRLAGPGAFPHIDGALVSEPGGDLGLFWCNVPTPPDFSFRLQYKLSRFDDNSGVFVRFPDPGSKGYGNPAYVPVDFGFEIQIDDLARWDGADDHHTGAVYGFTDPNFKRVTSLPPGQWNELQIDVVDQTCTVTLNGIMTTKVTNTNTGRGTPGTPAAPSFIGLQAHTGRVAFRHMRIQAL